jgi:hypothetical protein
MSWGAAALVVATSWGAFACDAPADGCIARGSRTAYSGTLTIQTTLDGAAPMSVQSQGQMILTDYDQGCLYEQEEFLMELDDCQLWLQLEPSANYPDASDPLPADVETEQACTLHTPAGAALLSIGPGKVTFNGESPSFSIDAAIGRIDGKPASGMVHIDFAGD